MQYLPDGSDIRMITDEVDTVMLSMNDIDSTIRSSSIFEKLHKSHTSCGISLTGFHYVGITRN